MRIRVVYTDYKNQKIYRQLINYKIKTDIKSDEYVFSTDVIRSNMTVNRSFTVDNKVNQYIDMKGNISYRFDLLPQIIRRRTKKHKNISYCNLNQPLDILCDALYINVLCNNLDENNMTIMLDESKLSFDNHMVIPDININVNIYDDIYIFERIREYETTKL